METTKETKSPVRKEKSKSGKRQGGVSKNRTAKTEVNESDS